MIPARIAGQCRWAALLPFVLALIGCQGPRGEPVSVKTVDLKAGSIKTVQIPKSSKPKLVVTSDEDIDVGLVEASKPAIELDKVVTNGRLPMRYHGKEFTWSYTGIENGMTLMLRSTKDITVTIKFWNGSNANLPD